MWTKLVFVALVAFASAQAKPDARNHFRTGVKEYFQDGRFSDQFLKFVTTVNLKHAFRQDAELFLDSSLICLACDEIIDVIIEERHNGGLTTDDLTNMAIELCTTLDIESEAVCRGAVSLNVEIILYIIDNRPELRAERICGIVAQSYGCDGSAGDWTIEIDETGAVERPKGEVSDADPLKVLQVTDIHYDPLYTAGSLASCPAPVCCQSDSGEAEDPADGAGFWGDYRDCDTPWRAVIDAMQHIKEVHTDIDYVYFTGDVISHRVWDTTREGNVRDLNLIYETLKVTFPDLPIYPILGNHEPSPLNVFSPTEITEEHLSMQWLFDEVADVWGEWLGEGVKETIKKGGYYSVLVKPSFRIIALNSNVAYTFNWWLLYDEVDQYDQLQWLSNELHEAEQNGEFVHILSHVPSSACYSIWSREFRRIVERYSSTITAIFNGHTHKDELIVYHRKENPTEAINVAWNGGSITTFSDNNPNYKVYSVDAENYEVIDFDSWIYNITSANLTPELRPTWFKLYSFKDAYGMDTLAPNDLRDLAQRMAQDHSLAEQYFRFRYREADTSMANGCSDSCLRNLVCNMVTGEFNDDTQCLDITADW